MNSRGSAGTAAAPIIGVSLSLAIRLALLAPLAAPLAACTGAIDGDASSGEGGTDAGTTMQPAGMVDIAGPAVQDNVQRFADAMCAATGACTIGTRQGHHPTAARAIDILTADVYGEQPTDNYVLGDRVAAYALAHQAEHGIWYVIWRQRYNDGTGWDPMEDRGSITQNHYDHVHISFDEE